MIDDNTPATVPDARDGASPRRDVRLMESWPDYLSAIGCADECLAIAERNERQP